MIDIQKMAADLRSHADALEEEAQALVSKAQQVRQAADALAPVKRGPGRPRKPVTVDGLKAA